MLYPSTEKADNSEKSSLRHFEGHMRQLSENKRSVLWHLQSNYIKGEEGPASSANQCLSSGKFQIRSSSPYIHKSDAHHSALSDKRGEVTQHKATGAIPQGWHGLKTNNPLSFHLAPWEQDPRYHTGTIPFLLVGFLKDFTCLLRGLTFHKIDNIQGRPEQSGDLKVH